MVEIVGKLLVKLSKESMVRGADVLQVIEKPHLYDNTVLMLSVSNIYEHECGTEE